jgi:uncharacterized protein
MKSDVAFSPAVKRLQEAGGSRRAYARHDFEGEISEELAAFVGEIETSFLATASADGQPYVQHRGGPPGFIKVLDAHTLGFLDFAGNKQFVSAGNLSENDRVCLMLIDYQHQRRVKVYGTAKMVPLTDELHAKLALPGYRARAERAVLITVTAWDANCPQHIPAAAAGRIV